MLIAVEERRKRLALPKLTEVLSALLRLRTRIVTGTSVLPGLAGRPLGVAQNFGQKVGPTLCLTLSWFSHIREPSLGDTFETTQDLSECVSLMNGSRGIRAISPDAPRPSHNNMRLGGKLIDE